MRVINWTLVLTGFYVLGSGLGLVELGVTIPDMLVGFGVSMIGLVLLATPLVLLRGEQ